MVEMQPAVRAHSAREQGWESSLQPTKSRALRLIALGFCLLFTMTGCHREMRQYLPKGNDFTASREALEKKYEGNAFQVAQGKRLFQWFNCSGCHSHGGGGMGPPLMDDEWRYGCTLAQIHRTIQDGRPNGMPAFVTKIPDEQIWQLAAYIRSMSGNISRSTSPGRNDELRTPVEQLSSKQHPPCEAPGGGLR